MSGPYAQAAGDYWGAGWRGCLPLPPRRKKEPPTGYTGWDGRYPSWPDVMSWIEDKGEGNVCLHLPDGVLGVDVDAYDGKIGGLTLERRIAEWGELPATWRTTSRDDGVSGIQLFRVPVLAGGASLAWPGKLGPGIETVHRGHRYAVVPPSIHPDTNRPYRWINPNGAVSLTPPKVADLPELPTAWVVGLTQGREAHTYQGAGMDEPEIKAWLEEHNHGSTMCAPMAEAMDDAARELLDGAHESLRLLMRIVGLAAMGHSGLYLALGSIRNGFIAEVEPRRADAAEEWTRSLFGAVDKIVGEMAKTGTGSSRIDPCEVLYSPGIDGQRVDRASPQGLDPRPEEQATLLASHEPVDAPLFEGSENSRAEALGNSSEDVSDAHQPREVTEEELALMAAARREREITDVEHKLEIAQEARQRLAARQAPPLEWLDSDAFLDGPEPEPLVPNMLYKDSLARIYGKAGCGKSFVVLDLAYSLATATPWCGHELERTRVAYVMAEGQRVNTRRGKAWLDRHQVDREELRGWFYAVPHKVLLVEEGVRDLVAKVREAKIGLVILDTKNAMMVGDENSATDINVMRMAMDAIREATDACVLLVDHTGLADGTRARGSSAGEGAVETEIRVENDGQSPAKVTVTMTRDKDGEPGTAWEFMLRMHPIDEKKAPAVLVPLDEDANLPELRPLPGEVARAWMTSERALPDQVIAYEGPGKAAVPDLARFMAHDAGVADPDGIGVTRTQAQGALGVRALGGSSGHSEAAVRRAWSALRAMGYIAPADGKDGSDGKAENTTGRHVWTARAGA